MADLNVKVSYLYSFQAKLHLAEDFAKEAYNQVLTKFLSFGAKTSISWKQNRVYIGRKVYAYIVFRGKKLAVSFALDPKKYEDTKYKGEDFSEKKRYEKAPFMMKITSARKLKYVLELIEQLFEGVEPKEVKEVKDKYQALTLRTLIDKGWVKKVNRKTGETLEATVEDDVIVTNIKDDDEDDDEEVEVKEEPKKVEEKKPEVKKTEKKVEVFLAILPGNKDYVNVDSLNNSFNSGDKIDIETLKYRGLVGIRALKVKILGRGVLEKKLEVSANSFSKAAVKKILAAGGKVNK